MLKSLIMNLRYFWFIQWKIYIIIQRLISQRLYGIWNLKCKYSLDQGENARLSSFIGAIAIVDLVKTKFFKKFPSMIKASASPMMVQLFFGVLCWTTLPLKSWWILLGFKMMKLEMEPPVSRFYVENCCKFSFVEFFENKTFSWYLAWHKIKYSLINFLTN